MEEKEFLLGEVSRLKRGLSRGRYENGDPQVIIYVGNCECITLLACILILKPPDFIYFMIHWMYDQ